MRKEKNFDSRWFDRVLPLFVIIFLAGALLTALISFPVLRKNAPMLGADQKFEEKDIVVGILVKKGVDPKLKKKSEDLIKRITNEMGVAFNDRDEDYLDDLEEAVRQASLKRNKKITEGLFIPKPSKGD